MVADGQPAALRATAAHSTGVLTQSRQQRIRLIQPERSKGHVPDIAHRVLPPIGVRVHFAGIVDIGDTAARGIAAPGAKHVFQVRVVRRQAARGPLQQENGVGIVVARSRSRLSLSTRCLSKTRAMPGGLYLWGWEGTGVKMTLADRV